MQPIQRGKPVTGGIKEFVQASVAPGVGQQGSSSGIKNTTCDSMRLATDQLVPLNEMLNARVPGVTSSRRSEVAARKGWNVPKNESAGVTVVTEVFRGSVWYRSRTGSLEAENDGPCQRNVSDFITSTRDREKKLYSSER
ncbi:uncharacterized protein LOC107270803 isoform X1 [Cephus cinctus]|uniref:Uncharacterized protein LOC107270803 isoform X1 n=1 Tax=Cephus cinctus TaxID=211228 RepID=A0AAJ7RMW8_CEPCN|nr:uncharacterized protein LOC107270803 isoform X1 [Cephus cinctus]